MIVTSELWGGPCVKSVEREVIIMSIDIEKAFRSGSQYMDPVDREKVLIDLAYNCAERQLLDGTASSQVITHFLKLNTASERNKNRLLEAQADLAMAKIGAIERDANISDMLEEGLAAFRRYSPSSVDEDSNR